MRKHIAISMLWVFCTASLADSIEGKVMSGGDEVTIIKNMYPEIDSVAQEMVELGVERAKIIEYSVAEFDLNNDGVPEIFAKIDNFGLCGAAGCMFVVLQKSGTKYIELLKVTAEFPIEISTNFENGYRTLSFVPAKKWVYTNGKYQ